MQTDALHGAYLALRIFKLRLLSVAGLITFQSSADVSQSITHAIEDFRHNINNMKARGDTALWDALALANDQLSEYSQKFPKAKKRIICLSDGSDTNSKKRSSDVSWSLFVSSQSRLI
jgi:Mg-chelatase subunit ChlD